MVLYDYGMAIVLYCRDNGVIAEIDIDFSLSCNEFGVIEISEWNLNLTQPDLALLEVTYPLTTIQNHLALELLRDKRNSMLAATDYKMLDDYPIPAGNTFQEMTDYRQALRDLPQNNSTITDISEVTFPVAPY